MVSIKSSKSDCVVTRIVELDPAQHTYYCFIVLFSLASFPLWGLPSILEPGLVSSGFPGISLVFSAPSSVNASVSTLFLSRSLVVSDRSSVLAPVPVLFSAEDPSSIPALSLVDSYFPAP